jgi:heat shock protein HtpX
MPDTLVAFGIRRGVASGMRAMFSSHPPLDARIAALRNMQD